MPSPGVAGLIGGCYKGSRRLDSPSDRDSPQMADETSFEELMRRVRAGDGQAAEDFHQCAWQNGRCRRGAQVTPGTMAGPRDRAQTTQEGNRLIDSPRCRVHWDKKTIAQ